MLILRPYQDNAVEGIRNSYKKGRRAPLLVLPTGGGKTVVFCYVAANTVKNAKRVLILVHRIELLRQTSKALKKAGVEHGLINPKFKPNSKAPVQVASVQTLTKRLNKYGDFDLIVVDEAHHATAGSWRKILEHYPKARVLGVTATPVRGDGEGLGQNAGGIFDDLVEGPSVAQLIELGYLVKPVIYAPATKLDLSGMKTRMGDYVISEMEERVDKPQVTGDAVEYYSRLCPGTPCVVFCVSVDHAEHVAEEFKKAGFKAFSVDGKMSDDRRFAILNGLGNGQVEVVTSCDLISEGTDIPAVGCLILLRPTQSLGLYIQQVGRGLRPSEGKDHCIILDHVGNVIEHGFPDDDREWSLDGDEKLKRKKKKKDEEKELKTKQCPSCYAVHKPAPKCTVCGHVYVVLGKEIEQVDGELHEITPEIKRQIRIQKAREVAEAKTKEDLERIAEARGYKKGWVYHVMKRREEGVTV